MGKSQTEKELIALAGEFAVASRLCLRGYYASLTLKDLPSVDIICHNPKNGKQVAIQVKTKKRGKRYFVPKDPKRPGLFFVFVDIKEDDSMDFYVVPSEKVDEISKREYEEYLKRHRNSKSQMRMISEESIRDFKDGWNVLGID